MAEIIYDTAPGITDFVFAAGDGGRAVGKAQLDRLSSTFSGADVIADDIFYLNEPFFQDGVVAQAVDNAKATGWPTSPRPATARARAGRALRPLDRRPPGFHNFDSGGGEDTTQTVVNVPQRGFTRCSCSGTSRGARPSTDIDSSS